ncbi:MAG: hypothetical protein AAGA40_01420 [Cyanobacteria bacterium P01_E01_bin.45]
MQNQDERAFLTLESFLQQVPGISGAIGKGYGDGGCWWVKFSIDLDHPLARNVVQEFGHILNYLSLNERLPTVFMPVSPPPYMNGGPQDYLSWVIESKQADFEPGSCRDWLEGRLPQPVDDESAWQEEY